MGHGTGAIFRQNVEFFDPVRARDSSGKFHRHVPTALYKILYDVIGNFVKGCRWKKGAQTTLRLSALSAKSIGEGLAHAAKQTSQAEQKAKSLVITCQKHEKKKDVKRAVAAPLTPYQRDSLDTKTKLEGYMCI